MHLLARLKSQTTKALLMCVLFGASGKAVLANPQGVVGGVVGVQIGGPSTVRSPYCATRKTEIVQTLANGTHITTKSEGRECRDSQGRTLHETVFLSAAEVQTPPKLILIFDPVERVQYTLDPIRHTARRNDFNLPPPLPLPPKAQAPKPAKPEAPPANKVLQPQVRTETLESKMIEGVWVDGTRVTTTYPAGFQGSDAPITTVEERWNSKELGLVVLLKVSDPRTGDRTEQFTDIDRSEPDPTLFQVPADYTITENGPSR